VFANEREQPVLPGEDAAVLETLVEDSQNFFEQSSKGRVLPLSIQAFLTRVMSPGAIEERLVPHSGTNLFPHNPFASLIILHASLGSKGAAGGGVGSGGVVGPAGGKRIAVHLSAKAARISGVTTSAGWRLHSSLEYK